MAEREIFRDRRVTMASPGPSRRVSWGAILAGGFAAIATLLLLSLLGAGIGGASVNPAEGDHAGKGMAIGAAIWFVISMVISLFVAGWVAARLSGIPNKTDGMLHGFVTWSVASLALLYVLTTAVGNLLGGAASMLGTTASAATKVAQASGPAASQVISQATGVTPDQLKAEVGDLASDPNFQKFTAGIVKDGQVNPEDRQALVRVLTQRRGMSTTQANETIDRWQSQLQEARQKAEQTAVKVEDKAASGVSKAGFGGFLSLMLGLIAAVLGGRIGALALARPAATEMRQAA